VSWLRDHEDVFDLALADPPYDEPSTLTAALDALGLRVGQSGRVVAKHFWRDAPPPMIGLLASERVRRFGETALTFYRLRDDETGTEGA
jgi:16S rRNA G966 N2-methylase RsmD